MNIILKAWYNIFPKKEGSPCWVIAQNGTIIKTLPGRLCSSQGIVLKDTTALDAPVLIRYTWIDKQKHSYIEDRNQGLRGFDDGLPVYCHQVGSLYGPGCSQSFIDSDYFNQILDCRVGPALIEWLEEYIDEQKIPWLKYALWAAIAILIIYLWRSGYLSTILHDIIPPAAIPPPTTTTPALPPMTP
jgi:hypothetical protein